MESPKISRQNSSLEPFENIVKKVVQEHNGSLPPDGLTQLQQALQEFVHSTNNNNNQQQQRPDTTTATTNTNNDNNDTTIPNITTPKENGPAAENGPTSNNTDSTPPTPTPADGNDPSKQIEELQKKIATMEQQFQSTEKSLKEQVTMWKDKNKLKHNNYLQLEEQKNKAIWEQKEKFEAQIQKLVMNINIDIDHRLF